MVLLQIRAIFHKRKKQLTTDLQLRFLKRLTRLLGNGYPLIEALEIIGWDKQLISTSRHVSNDLRAGYALDESLDENGFHHTIIAYLYIVRVNGNLEESLSNCIEMYEQRLVHIKKFQQTARYPLVLFFIFLFLMYFIQKSVLPSFQNLFQDNQTTSTMISASVSVINIFKVFLVISAVISIVIYFSRTYLKKKVSIERQILIYSKIPILRKFLTIQTSFLFATHVSSLLKTGLPLKEILEHIQHQTKLRIISYYAALMIGELLEGKHITGLLGRLKLIDKQLAIIFEKNSDTHALEKDLSTYAELSTEFLNRKITKIIMLIQPVFFIILAGFIVFIYLTLMWPMFQLLKTI